MFKFHKTVRRFRAAVKAKISKGQAPARGCQFAAPPLFRRSSVDPREKTYPSLGFQRLPLEIPSWKFFLSFSSFFIFFPPLHPRPVPF